MKEAIDENLGLSRAEMHKMARERVAEITKEFKEGFQFLEDYPQSVTFFGANQFGQDNRFCEDARNLAFRISKELGYAVVTGGGPGIMEAANRGAFEAGGESVGLLIKLPKEQIINKYLTASFETYYFFVRKVFLSFSAEAFIFYPGGFGTLDEFFEILTLIQTRKIKHAPLICVGSAYWNELREFMKSEMMSRGAVTEEESELFHIVDDHDKILEIVRSVPVRNSLPFKGIKKLGKVINALKHQI